MLLQEIILCVERFLSYVKKQCECTHMENISVLREVKNHYGDRAVRTARRLSLK